MKVSRVTPFLADFGGGKNLLFVKVDTDGGPHGWVECYTQAWYPHGMPAEYAAAVKDTVKRGFGALKFDPFPGPWRTPSRAKRRSRRSRRWPPSARPWARASTC